MTRAAPGGVRGKRVGRGEPKEEIPWRVLQDERMSFRAQGILTDLLSRPDGWRTSAARLAMNRPEGRDAVETALKELDGHTGGLGYLQRRRVQDPRGQWGWVWLYGTEPELVAAAADEEVRAVREGRSEL